MSLGTNNLQRKGVKGDGTSTYGVVTAIIVCLLSRGVTGSSPVRGLPPLAQSVEHRNTTQQHRKSKPLLWPSWSKAMDLSSIGVLLRAGSNPAGSISLDGSQQLSLSFLVFTHDGRVRSRGGADHCLGGRKKKHPSSKYYKSTTQQIFTQPNF